MPQIHVLSDAGTMAREAAAFAADSLRRLLTANDSVRLLAATGASQLQFLQHLVQHPGIAWDRVELFHLDEYIGIGESHPASFARYIRERLIEPTGIRRYLLLDGTGDPAAVAAEASQALRRAPIHLAFAGIGENAHLAFNDPPADFKSQEAYAIVPLDERCRQQQVGEGWFASLDDVPRTALSITVPQLLQACEVVSVVPDARKAEAVRAALQGPVTPDVPASALQNHPATHVFLDIESGRSLR